MCIEIEQLENTCVEGIEWSWKYIAWADVVERGVAAESDTARTARREQRRRRWHRQPERNVDNRSAVFVLLYHFRYRTLAASPAAGARLSVTSRLCRTTLLSFRKYDVSS